MWKYFMLSTNIMAVIEITQENTQRSILKIRPNDKLLYNELS